MKKYTPVLTIAGSDPSGGAGIQADLKTIASTGCYGMSVVTALTVQNTVGVKSAVAVDTELVKAQLETILEDITPAAIKIGMVANGQIALCLSEILKEKVPDVPLVVDPVMVSTSGHRLIDSEAGKILLEKLLPMATIVTPNYQELVTLTSDFVNDGDINSRVEFLRRKGIDGILVTGGDSDSKSPYANDVLLLPDSPISEMLILRADRVRTNNTHGTGCTLSSAIASFIALGFPLIDAVKAAKSYITRALIAGADVYLGHGHGPVNHSFGPRRTRFLSDKNH